MLSMEARSQQKRDGCTGRIKDRVSWLNTFRAYAELAIGGKEKSSGTANLSD